jgi:transposase
MSEWGGRSYNSTVAREMYTWAHGYFRQRLWSKVQITPCKAMAFVYEPGTTRTCDACGHVMPKSTSEKFLCSACDHAAHRDAHGARGNLLSAVGAAVGVAWDGVRR